jgi:hypothetical protein
VLELRQDAEKLGVEASVIGAACDEEDPREALMRVIMASAAWESGAYSAPKRAEVTRRLEASRLESERLEAIQAVVRGCLEQKSVESVERMTAEELPEFARSHPDCEASAVDALLQQGAVAAEDGLRRLAHRANRAVFDRMVQLAEALSVRPGWRQQSVGALSTSLKIMGSAMLAVSATARQPPEPSQTQQQHTSDARTARQQLEPDGGSQPEPEPEPELEPKPETEPEPSQTQHQHTGGAGEAAGDAPEGDDDDDGDGDGAFVLMAVRGALFLLFFFSVHCQR